MLHHDYEHLKIQAEDRRRTLQQEAAAYQTAHEGAPDTQPSSRQPFGQHVTRHALEKLGDALIAGGTRLKAASAAANISAATAPPV
jgi:hypothetical protein